MKNTNSVSFSKVAKSVLSVLMLLALLLSLMACGGGEDTSSDVVFVESDFELDSDIDDEVSDDDASQSDNTTVDNDDDADKSSKSGKTSKTKASKSKTSKTSKTTKSSKTSSNQNNSKLDAVVNNCYTSGKKIAKDKVTFNVMIMDGSTGALDYNKTDFVTYVEKNMNIKINFQLVDQANMQEKLTASLVSNKLPDMYWGMAGMYSALSTYVDNGKFIALDSYIKDYGPNIQKMFDEQPATVYYSTYDDGKIYMLPIYGVNANYGHRYYINKTWLSNLGLSVPKTTQELKSVLQAFKNNDPNKNGVKDEVPLAIPVGDVGIGKIPNSLFSPFGVYAYNDGYCIDQSTGKVNYLYVTNEYRNGLRFYKELVDGGLMQYTGVTSRSINNGTSGSVQTIGVFAATDNSLYQAVTSDSFVKNYMLLPPLTDNASRKGNWVNSMYDNAYADFFLVSKSCKYPEVAVRLADWMYSTEGSLAALYGTPGSDKAWDIDSNGKYVAKNGERATTPGYVLPHYYSQEVWDLRNSVAKANPLEKALQEQTKAMYGNLTVKMVPNLIANKSEQEQFKSVTIGDFNTKGAQNTFSFINGSKSIDNDWNGYITEMKKLGVDDAIAMKQTQYNRYNVFMKKAGK